MTDQNQLDAGTALLLLYGLLMLCLSALGAAR
jgi:hypothetical protein